MMRMLNCWAVLVFLLLIPGCGGADDAPDEAASAPSEQGTETGAPEESNAENAPVAKPVEPEKKRNTKSGTRVNPITPPPVLNKSEVDPLKVSRLADRTAAARRTPPPKGVDAYAEFQGTRVGVVHTGNLIGEIDPCG